MKKKDYFDAIKEFISVIKRASYFSNVYSIYLGGSVARGDFSPGRSDIDLYLVLKRKNKKTEEAIKKEAQRISRARLKPLLRLFKDPLSIEITTLGRIRKKESFIGLGFEYQNFLREGELLTGNDIKNIIPKPSEEEVRASAERVMYSAQEMFKNLTRIPPKVLKKRGLWLLPRINIFYPFPRMTAQLFMLVFRTLCVMLSGWGYSVSSKKDAVKKFSDICSEKKQLHDQLEKMLDLWEIWGKRNLSRAEFLKLFEFTEEIMPELFSIWQEN